MLKISVVVPVYNTEQYIKECIESIVNQTYKNIELILVDDGSTDSSGLICDEYAQKDKRIIVIHKTNGGHVSARKRGILQATGDYILYVDSDDWIDTDVVEKIVKRMGNGRPDIISFALVKEYWGNPEKRPENIEDGVYLVKEIEEITKRVLLNEDFFYTQVLTTPTGGKLFKRNLVIESQAAVSDNMSIGEDVALFDRCYMNAKSVMVYSLYAYHYRIREDSLTHNISSQDYSSCLKLAKCLMEGISAADCAGVPYRILYDIFYQVFVCCPSKILEKSQTEINILPRVKKGQRVIIYGKGAFAKGLLEYVYETGFVEVVGIVDSSDRSRIYKMADFDHLIIALTNGILVKKIYKELINMGIEKDKIDYVRNADLVADKMPEDITEIFKNIF